MGDENKGLIIGVVIFVVILIVGVSVYFYLDDKKKKEEEKKKKEKEDKEKEAEAEKEKNKILKSNLNSSNTQTSNTQTSNTQTSNTQTSNTQTSTTPTETYRYVRIYREKDGSDHHMNLSDVEVFSGGVNVALRKTVTASSAYDAIAYPLSRLVDGDKTNFTSTQNDSVEWFLIDLGQNYDIEKVVITNRSDCCQERLRNTKIQLSKASDMSSPKESRAITSAEAPSAVVTWNVAANTLVFSAATYRYVRIYKDSGNYPLNLSEVEVFSGGVNVALRKTVTASSVYDETRFPNSSLVDGIKTNANCAHTQTGSVQWFLIDLGQDYEIEKVVITNRMDCCQERLENTKIQLSKASDMSSPKESRAITATEAPSAVVTWNTVANTLVFSSSSTTSTYMIEDDDYGGFARF